MSNQSILQVKKLLKTLPDLFRHFPYINISVQFIPLYAYLFAYGLISSPLALLWMLPFVFSHAAGFAYNNLMDTHDPPFKKNPVTDGLISPRQARWVVLICLASSVFLFSLLYRSWLAWLVYLIYIFLSLAYSGLKLRLKETLAGPFVAAFIVSTAGFLTIALEATSDWDQTITGLILAVYLIYLGREIFHTYVDFENDAQAGYRTFAVRLSRRTQLASLALACIAGAASLLWSLYNITRSRPVNGLVYLLVALIVLATVLEIYYCAKLTPFHPSTAFQLYNLSFVLLAAVILDLHPLVASLLIWAFLINRRN